MVKKQKAILFGPLPPPYGGVSAFMSILCGSAIDRGFEVWSYSGRPNDSCGDAARYLDHRRLAHIRLMMRQGMRSRIADSTHFHVEYPNAVLLPPWLAAKTILRFHSVKIVHDGSLPSRYERFSAIEKALFRAAVNNVDELIVASSELATWFVETALYKGEVTTIPTLLPQPVDRSAGLPDDGLSKTIANLSRHARRVCSIGAFMPTYGFDQVAAVVERLRERSGEDIGLLLVDGGIGGEDGCREKVLKGRDWIDVASNVPHTYMQRLLAECEVFIRAFEHESYGLSRVEAIWSGLPVIATNTGETRGMLIYKFGDVDGLYDHLSAVLSGEASVDTKTWAAAFRNEAKRNLENYLEAITGESTS